MTLLSENYKNDITVSEIKEGHYFPRDTKMTFLSERYKMILLSENYKK